MLGRDEQQRRGGSVTTQAIPPGVSAGGGPAGSSAPTPGQPPAAAAVATAAAAPPLYTKFSQPVYSLATGGARPTLNLVTYASPIAIAPQRCFALGLYLGTVSHENMRQQRRGVLQVLRRHHARLFTLLGKTSAAQVDKHGALRDAGCQLVERFGVTTLADAACVLELEVISDFMPCGDHDVVLCRVARYDNLADDAADVLYTEDLRKGGYMAG